MKENSKYSMSLTYGPREQQIFKELQSLAEKKKLPESTNEVIRRGLHTSRYLSEVDEFRLLFTLSRLLKSISEEFDRTSLLFAENLAFSIFSVMIIKYGRSKADSFQTIPLNLRMFNQMLDDKTVEKKLVMQGMQDHIKKLADSIDTIFLTASAKSYYDVESFDKIIESIKSQFYDLLYKPQRKIGRQVTRGSLKKERSVSKNEIGI